MVIARTTDRIETPSLDKPNPLRVGASKRDKAGSATKPVSRTVRVIPSWAAES